MSSKQSYGDKNQGAFMCKSLSKVKDLDNSFQV